MARGGNQWGPAACRKLQYEYNQSPYAEHDPRETFGTYGTDQLRHSKISLLLSYPSFSLRYAPEIAFFGKIPAIDYYYDEPATISAQHEDSVPTELGTLGRISPKVGSTTTRDIMKMLNTSLITPQSRQQDTRSTDRSPPSGRMPFSLIYSEMLAPSRSLVCHLRPGVLAANSHGSDLFPAAADSGPIGEKARALDQEEVPTFKDSSKL